MSLILRQSTAKVISFGPFLDKTDGVALEIGMVTAIDHATTGIMLSKNGGALTIRSQAVTASTYDAYGNYLVTLSSTDTNTVGTLRMQFSEAATCLPVWQDFVVIEEAVYDALFAASAPAPAKAGDQMALINDAITAAKFDETTAFPLASADTGATQLARTGADADTLETLSDQLDTELTAVTSITNNTRCVRVVPTVIERPDSGTQTYRIELLLYDDVGNMEAPDAAPTIALVNQAGTDLSARLDSATMTLVSTGRYRAIYTATNTDTLEQLIWAFSVVEGGLTRVYGNASLIVDTTAVDFTAADRTKLESLNSDWADGGRLDLILDTANTAAVLARKLKSGNIRDKVGSPGVYEVLDDNGTTVIATVTPSETTPIVTVVLS